MLRSNGKGNGGGGCGIRSQSPTLSKEKFLTRPPFALESRLTISSAILGACDGPVASPRWSEFRRTLLLDCEFLPAFGTCFFDHEANNASWCYLRQPNFALKQLTELPTAVSEKICRPARTSRSQCPNFPPACHCSKSDR